MISIYLLLDFHTYPTQIYLACISLCKVDRVATCASDGVLRVGCY